MLINNWMTNVAAIIVANLNSSFSDTSDLRIALDDPISEIIRQHDDAGLQQLSVSRGWITLDGLPSEALAWGDVDADIIYALKVSNNSHFHQGSELEITDLLPDGMMLDTSDFDGTGPIQTSFEFLAGESGLQLLPEDVDYSTDGGQSYAHEPNGSVDAAIGAIRVRPRGKMAANSSFTIRFRARVP